MGEGEKMNYCGSCGSPIPNGQKYCSMCVGDIAYGRDGYYKQWALEQLRKQREQEEAEQAQLAETEWEEGAGKT
jgi:hypothetical protein